MVQIGIIPGQGWQSHHGQHTHILGPDDKESISDKETVIIQKAISWLKLEWEYCISWINTLKCSETLQYEIDLSTKGVQSI